MKESGASNLIVRPGQTVEAAHHNALVKLAESLTIARGRLKGRQDSDGFTARINVAAKARIDHPWKAAVEDEGEDVYLRILVPSHVDGLIPEIKGVPIDTTGDDGQYPRFQIPSTAWAQRGLAERAHIYLRYDLRKPDFVVTKVTFAAFAEPPLPVPWVWHKLFGWLTRQDGDIRWHPQMFFPAYFDVSQADKNTGTFKPWPRV